MDADKGFASRLCTEGNDKSETKTEAVLEGKDKVHSNKKEVVTEHKYKEHRYHPVTQGGYVARNYLERLHEQEVVLHEMRNHVF